MNHQFKPGDLALIIAGPNSGICVSLISYHSSGRVILAGGFAVVDRPSWRVEGEGLTAVFGSSTQRYSVKDGLIPPSALMPLRGDFAPEQQKAREVQPCL